MVTTLNGPNFNGTIFAESMQISFTHQWLELCVDDECLHRSLQQCQDWLKLQTCLILQYGVSEAVSMKTPVFLSCLTLSGWFDYIQHLKLPKFACEVPDILKCVIAAMHAKLLIMIVRKRCCLQVSSTLRICVHCRTSSLSFHLFWSRLHWHS